MVVQIAELCNELLKSIALLQRGKATIATEQHRRAQFVLAAADRACSDQGNTLGQHHDAKLPKAKNLIEKTLRKA